MKYILLSIILMFLLIAPAIGQDAGESGSLIPSLDEESREPETVYIVTSPQANETGFDPGFSPQCRVKDIAKVHGVRSNQLWGIGLIAGLAGTGDDSNSVDYTAQAIANMLERAGLSVEANEIKVKNFASVIITADLPPFVRPGDSIDITVSSIGNAKSLEGGTLIMTPLKAANGEIYAVAQGAVSIGGFGVAGSSGGAGGGVRKSFLTVGRVPGGAIVENEVEFDLNDGGYVTIVLNNPDFTTALTLADKIQALESVNYAHAVDPANVEVRVPLEYNLDLVRFISEIENLRIPVDTPAKVVINERTGTIVMGQHVQVLPVAIAHGPLTITINQYFDVSQPPALSGGFPVVVPGQQLQVQEGEAVFVRVSTADVVKALNALGVTPTDIVAIFQAIKAAGALQAELEIM
jgi:flagellar P-ring protein precursor FlgI